MLRTVEFLTYRLQPGSGQAFDAVMRKESAPLHRQAGIEIIAFGPSAHDADSYLLARAFESREQMEAVLSDFYASNAWQKGPRAAIIAAIDESHRYVCALDDQTINGLRSSLRRA